MGTLRLDSLPRSATAYQELPPCQCVVMGALFLPTGRGERRKRDKAKIGCSDDNHNCSY